jgi:hypothetical protein
MKRMLFLVFVASLVLAGCAKSSEQVVVSDGKGGTVTTTAEGQSTTYKDGKGNEVTMDAKGMRGTVDGKQSSISTDQVTEEEVGMPFYPGSQPTDKDIKAIVGSEKNYMSTRTTSDSPEKVMEFYKSKNPDPKGSSMSTSDMALVSGTLKDGRKFAVSARVKDGKTQISLSSGPGN